MLFRAMDVSEAIDVIKRFVTKYVIEDDRFGSGGVTLCAEIHYNGSRRKLISLSVPRSTGMRYCSISLFH